MAVGWGSEDSHVLELEALIQEKVAKAREGLQTCAEPAIINCVECGDTIPAARLKIVSTCLCVDCANELTPKQHNFRRGIYSGMR